jgi:hypothetical protein
MTTLTPLWDEFRYKPHQEYGVRWLLKREEDDIKGGVQGEAGDRCVVVQKIIGVLP